MTAGNPGFQIVGGHRPPLQGRPTGRPFFLGSRSTHGIREAVYAAIAIMSSSVSFATAAFMRVRPDAIAHAMLNIVELADEY